MVDNQEQWSCYLCNSARRGQLHGSIGRVQRQLSSHTVPSRCDTIQGQRPGKSTSNEVVLEPEQEKALELLKRVQKTPSRVSRNT